MKHLKKFNEAIIDYKKDNVEKFSKELMDKIESLDRPGRGRAYGPPPSIQPADFKKIADDNDIEVVDYDQFLKELPDDQKKTAPPKFNPSKREGQPVFALVNPVTKKQRIVLCVPRVDPQMAEMIIHMLKHETVHVGQHGKRPGYEKALPNPKDDKEYFEDTDEIMAYSQSVVDMLVNKERARNLKEAIRGLRNNQLWSKIRQTVTPEVLKKYKKYIYLYLQNEFPEDDTKKKEFGEKPIPKDKPKKDSEHGFSFFNNKNGPKKKLNLADYEDNEEDAPDWMKNMDKNPRYQSSSRNSSHIVGGKSSDAELTNDYSKMSQTELKRLLDHTIDNKNRTGGQHWKDKIDKISKYIK